MGGKSSGSSNNEAALARQEEAARQARIRSGTQRINSIFDGTTSGTGVLGAGTMYDPNATYYNADGSVWSASGSGKTGGSRGGRMGQSPERAFQEALASGKLYSGTSSSGGFNDDFFNGRQQAYMDYATPQLEDQYSDAAKQLTYALARQGNLNSSARAEKSADLQQLYDTNQQKVADDALSYKTQAQTAVEDARSNLITTLNATGDAESAARSALARSQALSASPSYSPLSQLFADFTNTLGVQAAQERAAAASGGSYAPTYNTGLFGNTGRTRVVG